MTVEGPALEHLTRRLADCPADFLDAPRIGGTGRVHVDAVLADLIFARTGTRLNESQLLPFLSADVKKDRNRLAVVLIAAWLLADPELGHALSADGALDFLTRNVAELAALTPAARLVDDPDRREELARFTLARLGLRPAGENEAQAQDRLTTISTAERQRVIAASRAAEDRARSIRDQLRKDAAQEAADKWNRE